jgi:hypothetical protein
MDRRRHRRCHVCAQRDRVVLDLVSPTHLFVAEIPSRPMATPRAMVTSPLTAAPDDVANYGLTV